MRKNVWGAVLVTIVALSGLSLIGYQVYQAGYRQGLLENAGEVVVPAFGGYPGFFPIFPVFGILFLFLFIGLISRVAFGRRWRGGPWGGDWEDTPMERRLADWHERAHDSEHTPARGRDDTT